MKKVFVFIAISVLLPVFAYAGLFADDAKTEQIANPMELSIIIPYDKDVNAIKFSNLSFDDLFWGRNTRQEKVLTREKTGDSIVIERRTDNGAAGSGKVYTVGYSIEKGQTATTYKFKAQSYKTYQQGLIMPFAVPNFTEQDLHEYIVRQPMYLNIELNSPYNTESTYSNFMRMAEKVPVKRGEKDPVTGKIYKDKFALSGKNGKMYFSLEVFPYHNGSKAVIHMAVPGYYTSANTVDFTEIIKEVKTQLEGIVNS